MTTKEIEAQKNRRQTKLFNYIEEYILKNMCSPTITEMMNAIETKSTSLLKRDLEDLEDAELIINHGSNRLTLVGYKLVSQ